MGFPPIGISFPSGCSGGLRGRGIEFLEQGLGFCGEAVAAPPMPGEPGDKDDEREDGAVEGQHEKNQRVFSGGEGMGALTERVTAQGGKDHEAVSVGRLRRMGIMCERSKPKRWKNRWDSALMASVKRVIRRKPLLRANSSTCSSKMEPYPWPR